MFSDKVISKLSDAYEHQKGRSHKVDVYLGLPSTYSEETEVILECNLCGAQWLLYLSYQPKEFEKEVVSSGMTLEKLIAMDPRAESLIRMHRVLTRFERLRKR